MGEHHVVPRLKSDTELYAAIEAVAINGMAYGSGVVLLFSDMPDKAPFGKESGIGSIQDWLTREIVVNDDINIAYMLIDDAINMMRTQFGASREFLKKMRKLSRELDPKEDILVIRISHNRHQLMTLPRARPDVGYVQFD